MPAQRQHLRRSCAVCIVRTWAVTGGILWREAVLARQALIAGVVGRGTCDFASLTVPDVDCDHGRRH